MLTSNRASVGVESIVYVLLRNGVASRWHERQPALGFLSRTQTRCEVAQQFFLLWQRQRVDRCFNFRERAHVGKRSIAQAQTSRAFMSSQ